ncbi:MAG: 4Fe-4S single cluster domain-containing protein [bacterium]
MEDSSVNGPGRRVVVWVQGCSLACPGCFNPGTHPAAAGERLAASALVERILAARTPQTAGVTFSGGEPFQQAAGLAEVVAGLAAAWPAGSRMAFSGLPAEELTGRRRRRAARPSWRAGLAGRRAVRGPGGPGRPLAGLRQPASLVPGSPAAPAGRGHGDAEIHLTPEGQVLLSGFPMPA